MSQFQHRNSKRPNIRFAIISKDKIGDWKRKVLYPDCSMTSGAIQQGVPTNVFRLILSFPHDPPRSIVAATPKSAKNTDPSELINILPA